MKLPRGVYYLSFPRILRSTVRLPFANPRSTAQVSEFEGEAARFLEVPQVQTMPHARICLYYLVKLHGLQPGDEILMSPTTLPDMVNMIRLAGARPVFVDFRERSHVMDLNLAREKLTPRTRMLFVTHLYGILPNLAEMAEFAREHDLHFIQDGTQSYGCRFDGRPLTEFADSSFFSTCALKDLHTHMGALAYSRDASVMAGLRAASRTDFRPIGLKYFWKFVKEDLIASLALNPRLFSWFIYRVFSVFFALDPQNLERLLNGKGLQVGPFRLFVGLFGGSGDERRERVPSEMLYAFNDLQAEVGLESLRRAPLLQAQRRQNTLRLIERLSPSARDRLPPLEPRAHHSFWRLPIAVDDPASFERHLFRNGIDPGKTTLPCVSEMEIFEEFRAPTPVARKMGTHSVFLPNFHYLPESEVDRVARVVNGYFDSPARPA